MSNNVLVIAFDGLDKDLIDQYGLSKIKQQELGRIGNGREMYSIKTSELFASFITGKTPSLHSIKGLKRANYENGRKERILDAIAPGYLRKKVRGFHALRDVLEQVMRMEKVDERYTKEDLNVETLFEEIEGSRAMFVPGYNPGMVWRMMLEWEPLKKGYSANRNAEFWDNRSYYLRKNNLLQELENDIVSPRSFLMCHFHRPDIYQHLYAEGTRDDTKLKKIYQETDDLAGEIKEKALDAGYDYIIFMSDHGLPTEDEHNENAFYSCNKELFGDETPHITDFHDKILGLVEEDSNGS